MNTLVCFQVWGYERTETATLVYITEPHDREPNILSHQNMIRAPKISYRDINPIEA